MTTITVNTPDAYDVVIGPGVLDQLVSFLDPSQRVAVVADENLDIAPLLAVIEPTLVIRTPAGERAKDINVVAQAWKELGLHGFTRNDLVVSVGGGATTDVAGFIAATWLRGIDVIHVPTTVLAMVDAAVGGKTGIDTAEGKNLVGSFHQPRAVIADTNWLATLRPQDIAGGLAEVIKCGFIADPSILDDIATASSIDGSLLQSLIERGVAVKAAVVADDARERTTSEGEKPGREALNYGHTLGHAIERFHNYEYGHGQAIAIGMVFAAELARQHSLISDDIVNQHRTILAKVGLPISHQADAWPALRESMAIDKKSRGSQLRLVALNAIGETTILARPSEDDLEQAYRSVSE